MSNERALNVQVPDKLYFALKKAAEQKSISLAALIRMLCSDWIMQQNADIKGVFTYPEHLLKGLTVAERVKHLETVLSGEYRYNKHGEACFDPDDDGENDDAYESLCTSEEVAESKRKLKEIRGE